MEPEALPEASKAARSPKGFFLEAVVVRPGPCVGIIPPPRTCKT